MHEIPGYTLLRPLGQGGMAVVYLAVQHSLGREVALKVLTPSAGLDDTASERFLREARIAASLHHPHIVPIHDFGVHEGAAYLAMEYEPGGTIAPLAGERLEPGAALRLVRDIAAALDYAHARGVVHRDIKPENILRRGDGAGMLSDFGVARLIQDTSGLTAEGTSIGTPHYMSPEQLRGDKVDGRSDLYSLGVVLWQLLTGELPYTGSDGWAIGTQHLSAEIPRLPPALQHLQGLVATLLAKTADRRPHTGAEVVRRIDALLAPPALPATTPGAPSLRGRRRRDGTGWQSAMAAGALALLVTLAWLGWRQFGAGAAAPASASTATPAQSPATTAAGLALAASKAVKSIAVLPFEDLSEAHDQGYFSDGISEELLNRLAQEPGLRVAGRTSSLSFKGKGATIAQIGKALDVTSVLEGSVRKDGDRLRVTVQLSNVADGYQIWSQSYDRKLTDIFAVQEDIASSVVDSLKLKLLSGAVPGGERHHVPSYEVYDNYLRGRQALTRNTDRDFRLGLDSYRKAVQLDPQYAEAWSGLAMAESFVNGESADPLIAAHGQARAMAAAERAVALDPRLGDAFATRGYLRGHDQWNWSGAIVDLRKAVSLEPRDGRNQLRYGYLLATLDRLPEARAALEQATLADPLFTPAWYMLGRVRAGQDDFEGARQAMSRVLAIDPNFVDAESYLAVLSLLQGDAAGARTVFARLDEGFGQLMADYSLGRKEQARKHLQALMAAPGQNDRYAIAAAYAWMGDTDQAFLWLDRCASSRDQSLLRLAYDPLLRRLRSDRRYGALLAKLKLANP